jgi:hypothetical protein
MEPGQSTTATLLGKSIDLLITTFPHRNYHQSTYGVILDRLQPWQQTPDRHLSTSQKLQT